MPIQQPTNRAERYHNRCSKKNIEEQKICRAERYEKRCAMKEEAKECVSHELTKRQTMRRRTSERAKSVSTGFFSSFF